MRHMLSIGCLVVGLAACSPQHYDVHCSGGFAAALGDAPDDTVFKSRGDAERFVEVELESVRRTWTAPSGRVWRGNCTIQEHEGRRHEAAAPADAPASASN